MKLIGAHVSAAGGVENAPLRAREIGAKAFALFTRNQKRWISPSLTEESIAAFRENCATAGYEPGHVLPHDGYLINLGHPEDEKLAQSRRAFLDEMKRCNQLGLSYLNFHPGSHLRTITEKACIRRIASSVDQALKEIPSVTAVVEITAGQGSNIGYKFEHIAAIIERVKDRSRIGVCIDTCHAFAAGYDLSTEFGYAATMQEFDRVVGMEYLKGMHLNDSLREHGSRVDRHENIGKGHIGRELFKLIMNDPRLDGIPMILETRDDSLWAKEIKMLYRMVK